jgi:hypothetical protein
MSPRLIEIDVTGAEHVAACRSTAVTVQPGPAVRVSVESLNWSWLLNRKTCTRLTAPAAGS